MLRHFNLSLQKLFLMRKLYTLASFCLLGFLATAQTNPAPQTLPYTQNFGTAAFTAPFAGMASWTGDGTRPYTTQAAAEATQGGADQPILGLTPGGANLSGGHYGDAPSANGRLTILQSGNAVSGTTQLVLAVNTTGASIVSVSYDLSMAIVNPRDFGICLQYRAGNTGAFITVAGSTVIYSNVSTNGGDADGPTDVDNYVINLPAAASNLAEVQLRWVTWNPTGAGSRSGIAFDNISVTSGAASACVAPTVNPSASTGSNTTSSTAGFTITAPSPAPNGYIVLMVPGNVSTNANTPVNATAYTVGTAIGAATVVHVGTGTAVNATGLTMNSNYSFFVYGYNNAGCTGGPIYLATTPLVVNLLTATLMPCATPTAAPTALVLTPASASIGGSFTASASANNYLVVRGSASTLSAAPVDGTTYTAGAAFGGGVIVSFGPNTTFNAGSLMQATPYFIFVFAANSGTCTGGPKYFATSLSGTSTTTNVAGAPAGYYNNANGLSCQALKTALSGILSSGTTVLSYTPGVWNAFNTTDKKRNDANTADVVWDMYSDNPNGPDPYTFTLVTNQCGNYSVEGDCYNREHSFPQSWFLEATPMVTDLNHIYATDGKVNGIRSNFPFGEVTAPTTTTQNGSKLGPNTVFGYSSTVFEPINEYKGDFARGVLYMAVRYESLIAGWQNNGNADQVLNGTTYQAFDDWQLKLLYKWHTQDPVSAKEQARNNAVFALQGNRNPFIDSADYVFKIWSCTGVLTPSAVNNINLPSNTIKAFPQPIANDNFTLQIETPYTKNTTVRIIDIQGKQVATYIWPANQRSFNIALKSLANGSYIAQIITPKGTVNKQLLVAKK
jgi:endonuclease I